MSSRLVQVTVVPTATVIAVGPKLKLSIFTSALDACACPGLAASVFGPLTNTTAAAVINVAQTKIHTPLPLMIFFLSNFLQLYFSSRLLRRLRQRGVHYGQGMLPANIIHVGNSQYAPHLLGRHFHRTRRIRFARLRLRKRGRCRGVKRHVAFHLLHRLV